MPRILALDHGSARCGCAVSDPSGTLATPLRAVERPDTKKGLAARARLADEQGAERVVVGLPLTL
ncbi:MAG: RuvX/YqgF family protein [Thermoleophilaceae bacterium]